LGVVGLATALRLWQLDLLPPGLFFDEAYNGLDTRQILQESNRPLFFAGNNGREPLFIYLQALSVAAFGATPYALRLVSALVGILTIPIIYFGAFVILKSAHSSTDSDRRVAWLALVAAVGMTISYWHLGLSRLGFRANLLIPISALAVAFFWRAWTGQRYRDYLWTGIWLALAMYTYLAARFLPLVLLAFVTLEMLIAWWSYRGRRRELWPIWKARWRDWAPGSHHVSRGLAAGMDPAQRPDTALRSHQSSFNLGDVAS
jgi:4-amino-4-deoxy-L-arabinose transferase-like glycosyltransferase